MMVILAALGPAQKLSTTCGRCGTTDEGGDCPSKAEREEAKRLSEDRLRHHGEETDSLIRDVEEWVEEPRE